MISTKNIHILLFLLVLLSELYLPSFKFNFIFQVLILTTIITSGKNKVSIAFLKTILPLFLIFFIGLIGFFNSKHNLSFIIKDITYFLKPIIAISISYLIFKRVQDFIIFLKTIFFIGCLTAFVHLFGVFFIGDLFANSVSDLRGNFGLDNFIEIFAFYLLMFSNKFIGIWLIKKRKFRILVLFLLLLSIYLYFSRTMLVIFILVGLSLLGYIKITKKTIQVIGIAIIFLSLFYAYLFSVKLDRNSKGVESFLYKIKIAPEEIFKTKIDRENHKELWDHWRGYEAKRAIALMNEKPSSYILGTGFGSLVNLKFKAPVGGEGMKFISRLHNGYVFVFYKTGIIGLLMLLLFLFKLYLKVYQNNREDGKVFFTDRLIASVAVFYFFTSLIISGIYIPKDAIMFLLGGLLSTQDFLKKS